MSLALLTSLNILTLICMYMYFKARINRLLDSQKLLERLRGEAEHIVDRLIQKLNMVTDRNINMMEAKVEDLQGILDTADKRIILMQQHVQKEEGAGELYTKLKTKNRTASEKESSSTITAKHEEILGLYRTGISADLIAKKLDMPSGEVQLVISLHNHKGIKKK